jgi:hypothetical protein
LFDFVGQDNGHDDTVNRSCLTENNANKGEKLQGQSNRAIHPDVDNETRRFLRPKSIF